MHSKYIFYFFLLITSFSAFGLMIGAPTKETPFEKFGTSVEFDYDRWKIRYDVGPNYKLSSYRGLIKPSLGIVRFVEGFGYIGTADFNIPSVSPAVTDFNGSQEMAFGLGIKTHYAVFYPGVRCDGCPGKPIRWYATASWLTTKSYDKVEFGGGFLHFEDSYRFQQVNLGIYGSWELGRTKPYIGAQWTYITGRKYRKSYSQASPTPFLRVSGLYTDPTQYPKPVLGIDIDLGKGYTLSFETFYFGKDETSIGVSLSQLYQRVIDDFDEDKSIQKP